MLAWKDNIDWWRLSKIIGALVVSASIGYYFQPMLLNNPNAINTVVTIFSILAGFLVAIITFITEPILQQAKKWEELQHMKNTVRHKLLRHQILFFIYLLTLGVALIMYLTPQDKVLMQKFLQTLFLGSTVFVFLASLSLPSSLMKIQMERYEAALKSSRPKVVSSAKEVGKTSRSKAN